MKILFAVVLVGFGLMFGPQQANAQYPNYGSYGYAHGSHHSHIDHHYNAQPQPYVSNHGGGYNSYGAGNAFAPSYSGFQGSNPYPQMMPPPVSSYSLNSYYVAPSHNHHGWHAGHYLFGHR